MRITPRTSRAAAAVVLVYVAAAAAAVASAGLRAPVVQTPPDLRVTPADALVDVPTHIIASGLAANQSVTIVARAVDGQGQAFSSQAKFKADAAGVVDLDRASASGGYDGVDPMGLFWSMEPAGARRSGGQDLRFAVGGGEPIRFDFDLLVDGRSVATASVTRRPTSGNIRAQLVRDSGLVGRIVMPAGEGKHPAILHFGGSEGGMPRDPLRVQLLASRGYVVLSLAYFDAPSLPPTLTRIPLEYFRTAIDWLKAQPYVDGTRIGLMSASRGTEAALLLASAFDDIRAVVAISPSSVVWGGWDHATTRWTGASAWTYTGREVAYMTIPPGPCGRERGGDGLRCALQRAPDAVLRSRIQVEKASAALLLLSGLDDRVSPTDVMVREIEARRAKDGVGARDVALYLPHAGHVLGAWYGPPAMDFQHYGGNREGAAKGFEKAWPAVLRFLHEQLGGEQ